MFKLALFGGETKNSLSPFLFRCFANNHNLNIDYRLIDVKPLHFAEAVSEFFHQGGTGANITAPLKSQAFSLVKKQDEAAVAAQAGNVLYCREETLYITNTDGFGLCQALEQYVSLKSADILLIGSGGALKGVVLPLLQRGARVTITARSNDKLQVLTHQFPGVSILSLSKVERSYDIVVNATSASQTNTLPELTTKAVSRAICLDMVYQKRETIFQRWCLDNGARIVLDGYTMLVYQAAKSFETWFGFYPSLKGCFPA